MSHAVYDSIADQYKASKLLPFRRHIEEYTIFELMGDLRGKRVADFACGEGIYSRRIMRRGAARTLGVDISKNMIDLAEEQERSEPLGVRYFVGDCKRLSRIDEFDIILGSYLLNYAETKEQLRSFCNSVYINLKDGGRFIGFNDNPANDPHHYPLYKKYGFLKSTPEPRKEGDPIQYKIMNEDGSEFEFNNFYLSKETYEQTMKEVGFKSFVWHHPRLSPEARANDKDGFWNDYMEFPPMIAFEAIR